MLCGLPGLVSIVGSLWARVGCAWNMLLFGGVFWGGSDELVVPFVSTGCVFLSALRYSIGFWGVYDRGCYIRAFAIRRGNEQSKSVPKVEHVDDEKTYALECGGSTRLRETTQNLIHVLLLFPASDLHENCKTFLHVHMCSTTFWKQTETLM
ncbi:hypothetical protein MPH_06414 [Macrophomina phaseolina MS6]|uniref:Uncharacterized protein n=1 Tax=Macrophomina phaseolina (strain MS6) TaxID=1126212 RepID=K2RNR1_MACPH|nr:hypothetical protein MPH_06414 [Macrophomina phaseolina MS6]